MPRISGPAVFYTVVTLFWAGMWALLLRSEIHPSGSIVRKIPLDHVADLLFRHEQSSDLYIHSDKTLLGRFRISPHLRATDNVRLLDFSGSLQLRAAEERRRITWDGALEFAPDYHLDSARAAFSVLERSATPSTVPRTEIMIDPDHKRARCIQRLGPEVIEDRAFSLDEDGLRSFISEYGIAPEAIDSLPISRAPKPVVRAQQSSLKYHGEQIDTFLVTIEENGQTLVEAQIGQLGQILKVTSIFGWTLENE